MRNKMKSRDKMKVDDMHANYLLKYMDMEMDMDMEYNVVWNRIEVHKKYQESYTRIPGRHNLKW